MMHLKVSIRQDDTDTDFLNFKGSILFKLERYEDARKCYDNSLSINSNNFGALVSKAAILLNTDIDGSLKLLNKARLITEKESSFWYNFGVIYLKKGSYSEAEESFKRAIQYGHEDFPVLSLIQIGVIFRRKLQYDKAVETYDKVIKISPDNPEVYLNKGIALGHMERHLDALDCFNKSFNLNPLNYRVLLSKAIALANLKLVIEAGVNNYWKLKAIDSIQSSSDIGEQERVKLIKSILGDNRMERILVE